MRRPVLQDSQSPAQILESRSRFEEHPAEIVGRRQDSRPTFQQHPVIEGVHLLEGLRLKVAEPGEQDSIGKLAVVGRAKRVPVGLHAVKGQSFARVCVGASPLHHPADPQLRHRMKEVERRAHRNPEQPVA